MSKRVLDICLSALALTVLSPVLLVAALGIRLTSPGPIFFRAPRMGRRGRVFTMYKFRTMQLCSSNCGSSITARADPRVFPFGAVLRACKADELPQLVNILQGEMSIVGPRPEAPDIVTRYYSRKQLETLEVPPGLASPGSIFNYTHGERLLSAGDTERDYVEKLLPLKLEIDAIYLERASLLYDLSIIGRTLWVIASRLAGKKHFSCPPEASLGLASQKEQA